VEEARRLRRLKESILDDSDRRWMDRTITETEATARAVGELLERSRVDREIKRGNIGFRTRLLWVFRDSHKLKEKYSRLLVCHQSLTSVITSLHGRNPAGPTAPTREVCGAERIGSPPSYDLSEMLAWRRSKYASVDTDQKVLGRLDKNTATYSKR
jgi:hypothetical protein